jgi:hypothetical protein
MKNQRKKQPTVSWEAVSAVCCFGGGIGAALVGSVLTAVSWLLAAPPHPWLRSVGTALLIATIPLLILAGYCMDWAERDRDRSATQKRRNGLDAGLRN